MRWLVVMLVVACGSSEKIRATASRPLPAHTVVTIGTDGHPKRRMVPPEVFLRSYLMWFGGLAPLEIQKRSRGLMDRWNAYLVALGLPDYQLDMPRAEQSNAIMVATFGRLGEALCVRAAEHDFKPNIPVEQRVIFAFDAQAQFPAAFDILHRTFLGYPVRLAPEGRIERFRALHEQIAASAPGRKLPSDQIAWVAICTALVQHPETGLY